MSDKTEDERQAGMLEALNKGIAEANGTLKDKELVLIKRAKRGLKKIVDAAPGSKTVKDALKDRDDKIAEMEQ